MWHTMSWHEKYIASWIVHEDAMNLLLDIL